MPGNDGGGSAAQRGGGHLIHPRRAHALAGLILVLQALLLIDAALSDSPVVDEPMHVTRGLVFWAAGETRVSVAHPPLANALQAIPGALVGAGDLDWTALPGWKEAENTRLAAAYLRADYERARSAIVAGRFVTIALTLLLGAYFYVFLLGRGRLLALAALLLLALNPVVLAHGHLFTTDMPVTVAATIAVCEFARYVRTRGVARLLTFSAMTGVALAMKFSALFLAPALLAAGAGAALAGRGRFAGMPRSRALVSLARDVAVASLVVLLVLNASYRFQRTGWTAGRMLSEPEPQNWITARHRGQLLEKLSPLPALPSALRVPLPYTYVFGVSSIRAHDERGHGGWFMGRPRRSPLYFPVLLVVKNPLATLAALGLGTVLLVRRRRSPPAVLARRRRLHADLALWIAPLLFFALGLRSGIQIGVRHMLPLFPFLALLAATGLAGLARRRTALAAALVALLAAEVLASRPAYLGHFSWLIGGSRVGHRVSMVGEDWAQDAGELAAFVKENGIEPLHYVPYGLTTAPELQRAGVPFRKISCKSKPEGPGWVAVHAGMFVRAKKGCATIPRDRPPDATVRDHVWLWRLDPVSSTTPTAP